MTERRSEAEVDLAPPWIVFSDGGKPLAILPAGRPGEVADVRGIPAKKVWAIVNAANQTQRRDQKEFIDRVEALATRIESREEQIRLGARKTKHRCKP